MTLFSLRDDEHVNRTCIHQRVTEDSSLPLQCPCDIKLLSYEVASQDRIRYEALRSSCGGDRLSLVEMREASGDHDGRTHHLDAHVELTLHALCQPRIIFLLCGVVGNCGHVWCASSQAPCVESGQLSSCKCNEPGGKRVRWPNEARICRSKRRTHHATSDLAPVAPLMRFCTGS